MKSLPCCLVAAVVLLGCEKPAPKELPPPPPPKPALDAAQLAVFAPLPASAPNPQNPSTPEKVALGKQLYFEKRLSKNQDISCNTCHDLSRYGDDGQPVSGGHKGQKGTRNSNTVLNAALQFRQFWDGRAADVEDQSLGPIEDSVEMANTRDRVVATIKSMPEYVAAFQKAFPGEKDPLAFANIGKAIGAFERTLLTPGRWDKYLSGDKSALTDEEVKGAQRFLETGCHTCHMGPLLGGSMYQKAGLVKPWPNQKDLGRFKVTKQEADKLVFKVAMLRNVEKTGPYFHDGSVAELDKAVAMMAEYQLGKSLTPEQTAEIVTFLKALTGPVPAEWGVMPELPKSTAKTPKPDPR